MHMTGEKANNLNQIKGLSHSFFGRVGGTSPPPWDGLNTSFDVHDSPARVKENLARIRFQLGIPRLNLFSAHQIHGNELIEITDGMDSEETLELKADLVYTELPSTAVAVRTADCIPLLLTNKDATAICAVHAGWRGTFAGVAQTAIERFSKSGFEAKDLIVAIGPGIEKNAFEVGPELIKHAHTKAESLGIQIDDLIKEGIGDRSFFDLHLFLERNLRALGVENIERVGGCTHKDHLKYFSYRKASGHTGRQMSVISLTETPILDPEMFA